MKRIFIVFIIQFFALSVLPAQSVDAGEITYEEVKGKIIIPATVDGIEGRYIFDTGAPMCLTYTRAMQQQGALSVTKALDANGQEREFRTMDLKEIMLGGQKFGTANAIIFEKGNLLECYGVDGIIGSDLFTDKVVRIDSKRKVIIIGNDAMAYRIPVRNSIAMSMNGQNTPFITVSMGMGVEENVMFDSGSGAFLDITQKASDHLQEQGCLKVLAKGFGSLSWSAGGMERADEKQRVQIADVRVGVGKFRNVTTVTMNGPASRMGSGMLKYGIITLDFPAGRFSFEPFRTEPVEMAEKYWNVDLTLQGDRIVAGCIWESRMGELKGGEKVVEINGERTGTYDPCLVMTSDVMKLEGDEMVIVVVDAEGQEKKVILKKE